MEQLSNLNSVDPCRAVIAEGWGWEKETFVYILLTTERYLRNFLKMSLWFISWAGLENAIATVYGYCCTQAIYRREAKQWNQRPLLWPRHCDLTRDVASLNLYRPWDVTRNTQISLRRDPYGPGCTMFTYQLSQCTKVRSRIVNIRILSEKYANCVRMLG